MKKNKDQTTATAEWLQLHMQNSWCAQKLFTTQGTYSFSSTVNIEYNLFLFQGDLHNPLSLTSGNYSAVHPHPSLKVKAILYKTEGFQVKYYSEHSFFFPPPENDTLFLQAKPQETERKIINSGFQSVCQWVAMCSALPTKAEFLTDSTTEIAKSLIRYRLPRLGYWWRPDTAFIWILTLSFMFVTLSFQYVILVCTTTYPSQ